MVGNRGGGGVITGAANVFVYGERMGWGGGGWCPKIRNITT